MSYIKLNNEYFRTPEFISFIKQRKAVVYFFLLSAVIRESEMVKNHFHGANYIYNQHFLKGKLVSRYSQSKLKEYLKTSQSSISVYLTQLEKDGLIRKIFKPTAKGKSLYYQFGVWEGDFGKESYKETLWFDVIFTEHYLKFKSKKTKDKKKEAEDYLLKYLFGGDKEALRLYAIKNGVTLSTDSN